MAPQGKGKFSETEKQEDIWISAGNVKTAIRKVTNRKVLDLQCVQGIGLSDWTLG